MLHVSSSQMMMQEATVTHGLFWFRPRGRTSSKGVCECTVLSCTRSACSRGYKRGERGRGAPKSLLEEEMSEASADVRTRSAYVLYEWCDTQRADRPP